MFRHALIWSTLLATVLASRSGEAQLAPTGTHYSRPSDTGFTEPNEQGGYSATVPLDLPQSRGGLPIPLQIVSGTHGFGAAGVGWDVPLSFVYVDHTFAHRRPAGTSTNGVAARERVTVALLGRSMEMLVQGDHWIARNDPTVTMKAIDGTWQVVDANGIAYTFLKNAQLYATGGPGIADPGGLWLLDSIQGRGGAKVQMDYKVSTVAAPPATNPLITIDLQDIQYNPDPSDACFKHEIDLTYDADEPGAPPQSLSILGERVIARYHKLGWVVVRSRGSCGDTPNQLRSYELKYATDPDTRQQQLSMVLQHGRPDITSDTPTLPVATYHYGTASTVDGSGNTELKYGTATDATTIALPSGARPFLGSTGPVTTSQFQPPDGGTPVAATQTLQDFNGDGRADLITTRVDDGSLQIAPQQSGLGFGSGAPLTDNTLTKKVLDTRSSTVEQVAVGYAGPVGVTHEFVWTQSIDVNGDGRIDVIDASEKTNKWVVYLNTPDIGPNPAPSGIKWVRLELDVTDLRSQIAARVQDLPVDYLPLSSRKTGSNYIYRYHWHWQNGQYVRATVTIISQGHKFTYPEPPELKRQAEQQTYTEYKVFDVNGDGYPDVVFDSLPSGYPDVVWPEKGHNWGPEYYTNQEFDFTPKQGNTLAVAYNVAGPSLKASGTVPFAAPTDLTGVSGCGVEWWSGDDADGNRLQSAKCLFADTNGDGLIDRVESDPLHLTSTVLLGTGFSFGVFRYSLPFLGRNVLAAQWGQDADLCTQANPPPGYPVRQDTEFRDLTGDGIPDLVVPIITSSTGTPSYKVFIGTGAGFAAVPIPIDSDVSSGISGCNGGPGSTSLGFFDINGDGRPDLLYVTNGGNSIGVKQLLGGSRPGRPEAGRLIGIDNGYGASIQIDYVSAKNDSLTAHNVPFPEIVVSSIRTVDDTYHLGGALAATEYAYGNINMFYDSVLDAFRSLGYQRRVALTTTGTGKDGGAISTASISDAYPLDHQTQASLHVLSEKQRMGRYLLAGRLSDTTSLAGEIGNDPWPLLNTDVTTDPHRVAGVHYSVDAMDTHYYADASSPSNESCVDFAIPYDFDGSTYEADNYNPCSARGFLYTRSTQSWRGSEAPPSQKNVQVYTSVRSVDDFGRVTSIIYQNDATQDNDDVCVDTTYASPTDSVFHVLSAPAARKVWACGNKEDGHTVAEESWEYDKQVSGLVFQGLPTAHTVYRHATDTGALLGVSREYDADYDAMGNPIKVTTTRDDNAWRTTTIEYDDFGISATGADVVGSDATMRHVSQLTDATSGALLSSTDENGTTHRYTWDTFGRPSTTTVQRHDDAQPGTLSVRSYDEDSCTPHGRRITVQTFTDPVISGDTSAVAHVSSTCLDELGRERFSEVQLGGDYNATLIAGKRTYDQVGRTVFEADAYQKGQNETTAYGTSRIFNDDGSLLVEIRGPGPQQYTVIPDPTNEIYPTAYWHTFDNHLETTAIKTADALTTGTPQDTVYRQAVSTGIGRVLSRSTYQNNSPIELATFSYDLLGNQSSIERFGDPVNGNSPVFWSWQFDSLGHVTSLSEPANAPQSRTYDSWGELKKIEWQPTSPEPVHGIEMSYDSLGRTLSSYEENNHVLDPLTVNTYSYDVAGSSSRITPQYVMGRLAKASSPTEDIVLGYDGLGNVNARSFTDLNNVEYVEQQGVHADGSQAWTQLELPDDGYAAERVDYEYDSASRLRWMWFSSGQTTQELYNADQLDAWGRVRHAMFGMTAYTANYFDVGRRLPKSMNVASTLGTRTIEFDGFDAVGREVSRSEQVPNVGGTTSTTYDALGRLASSVRVGGGATTQNSSFSYDALGNITSLQNFVTHVSPSFSYQSGGPTPDYDQLCTISYFGHIPLQCNVVHDSFGNVVSEPTLGGTDSFSYFNSGDVKNVSNTAGMTARFAYDPFGDVQDLNITSTAGQVRHDQHFGDLITLRTQNAQSPSTSFISRQFPGPGMTISRRGSQGSWVFQFSGPQGLRFTTDEDGKFLQDVSYTPYGTATSTGITAGSPTFTTDQWNDGDALDGFGLVQVGKRIYNPSIGRFLSRDPLVVPRTAATTNPYAFAMNDPINLSDPSGMDPCPGCGITTTGGGSPDPSDGSLAATAFALADYFFASRAMPGMPIASPSPRAAATFSAAFDARLSQLQVMDYFLSYDHPTTLQWIGGKFVDAGGMIGGGAAFAAGAALCTTPFTCVVGGTMMLAASDVGGAHFRSFVGAGPAESLIGQHLGHFAQEVEEGAVDGFGLASGVAAAGGIGGGGPVVTSGPRLGRLTRVADDTWESSGGLRYGPDPAYVNRVQHVLAHTVPDATKPVHTVFNVGRSEVLSLVDEAWGMRGAPLPNDPMAYVIPMNRVVGTAGETSIRIVVRAGTNNLITAYPQ